MKSYVQIRICKHMHLNHPCSCFYPLKEMPRTSEKSLSTSTFYGLRGLPTAPHSVAVLSDWTPQFPCIDCGCFAGHRGKWQEC